MTDIKDFDFDAEFEVNKVAIPNSTHIHGSAPIASYLGLPLALGGATGGATLNNKLEMFNSMESLPAWIEYEDYPYSKT